jgi:amidohydrolase
MSIPAKIAALAPALAAIRRDLHRHPELAFAETRTADIVARELIACGVEVTRGVARTGVVGTLRAGSGARAIALRADMDCLPLVELNEFAHRSSHEGRMHACGHDGHTTMLLGAARHLAATRRFDGTVHFIFQPAEEMAGGGKVMVEEGLFERFPAGAVFGMHNLPGIAAGKFAMRVGPIMAAIDEFEIVIRGAGGHAAFPHLAIDPVLVQAHVVSALQSIVSRQLDPLDNAVLTITQVHGGDAYNVIPESVVLRGTLRSFESAVRERAEAALRRICEQICAGFGARAEISYRHLYPATVNTATETQRAARAAACVVGETNVDTETAPLMGSEDFAYMLQARPGAYIFIGNGAGEGSCMLHSPRYDFNDEILTLGASYWVSLVEQELAIA